jgi:hypothetical protein
MHPRHTGRDALERLVAIVGMRTNARLIVCSKVIGRPQTGQMTSTAWMVLSVIPHH